MAYLITIGVKSLKPQTIAWKKLFFLTCGFIWTFCCLSFPGPLFVGAWLLAIGLGLGWVLGQSMQIRVNREKKEIELPGSPLPLVLFLSIFAVKYVFGYLHGAHAEVASRSLVSFLELGFTGLFSGFFLGLSLSFWRKTVNRRLNS